MATINVALAASHTPGLTGWFHKAPEDDQRTVRTAYDRIHDLIVEANPDVLLIIGNDHVANNRVSNSYAFTFAGAPEHRGPDEWFKPWLRVEDYELIGAPEIAAQLHAATTSSALNTRLVEENLRYDDNVSVPVVMAKLVDAGIPIIPVLQNCTVPPVPDERVCYEFGQRLGEAIAALPDDLTVGLLGSGGMSHEPGGPRYLEIDEKFDRWFLDLLEDGSHAEVLEQATFERMEQAGSGGTAELLSWIVVMGAIGEKPCTSLGYAAFEEWRCGIGAVQWHLDREPVS